MTICWWVFGIRRSSIRLWKAEPLLYKNSQTKNFQLDVDGNKIVLKTRGSSHDDVGPDAFYWMSNSINMPSGAETKTKNKQFKMKNKPFVNTQWEGPSKCFFGMSFGFGYFWFSQKSFLHVNVEHIRVNHMVCSHLHPISLRRVAEQDVWKLDRYWSPVKNSVSGRFVYKLGWRN